MKDIEMQSIREFLAFNQFHSQYVATPELLETYPDKYEKVVKVNIEDGLSKCIERKLIIKKLDGYSTFKSNPDGDTYKGSLVIMNSEDVKALLSMIEEMGDK